MFSSRRRRKASPEPDSPLNSISSASPETGRRRRRVTDADHFSPHDGTSNGSATITPPPPPVLPTFRSSKRKPPSQLPTFQAGNTCNNFLLGGQFYPGKDKKRKHLRKRTMWHRICCSSPWRMAVSVILATYVTVWHVMVPTTHILLDYDRTLSGGKHGFVHVPSSLSLPSIEQQRMEAIKLKSERNRLQYSSDRRHEKRMKILEQIAPDWYHRNDGALQPNNDKNELSDSGDEDDVPPSPDDATLMKRRKRRSRAHKRESSEENVQQRATRHHLPRAAADSAKDTVANATTNAGKISSDNGDHSATTATDAIALDSGKKSGIVTKNGTAHILSANTTRRDEGKLVQRTLQNMDSFPLQSNCPASLSSTNINTTLVIQCSLERLWILEETCRRWRSPIVVAIHVPHGTVDEHPSIVTAKEMCPQLAVVVLQASEDATSWAYPVNRLRNMALDAVQTSHILVTDIDFVPSINLDETIRTTIAKQQPLFDASHREAMIVPAFERLPPRPCSLEHDCSAYLKKNSSFIPQTLGDIRACTAKKDCTVFQRSNNWEGHSSTRSESWLAGNWYEVEDNNTTSNATGHITASKTIRTIKCFDSLRYEPYVVLRWCPISATTSTNKDSPPRPIAPYYDERFYGYGKNKIQLISHLRFTGYHFSVLPKGFITHNPHMESAAKATWNNVQENKLHQEMDALYPEFLEELFEKYKGSTKYIVQQCKRKKK